ncbi:MAG: peptidase T [Proteobacteria bacterium]|nr:peptidase T [Pseudomonadota bacterium]MCP4921732.1 peptidase T [Pseudomonadota bacterium]
MNTDDTALGRITLGHLESVVAIDSQSDEASTTIPTTEGQRVLAAFVGDFYRQLGGQVETDGHANVIATFPGRGAGKDRPPLALMVHLDTARGTMAVPSLTVTGAWDGRAVRYAKNPTIKVDLATYPSAAEFAGQDLVHGPGDAPFGLDDKLGLAHCMTLAKLLAEDPELDHPPLIFIGRPDEEVGRMEAIEGLAVELAGRGVKWGYTVDGILPFEINVANFNAAGAHVQFADGPIALRTRRCYRLDIGGVNTHGATAKAEGHRSATRLAAEILRRVGDVATPLTFESDALRDCDATSIWWATNPERFEAAIIEVVGNHVARGASWELAESAAPERISSAAHDMLLWVADFYASRPGFVLPCEASEGHQGYTALYRARRHGEGVRLDVRIRDFDPDALLTRIEHVRKRAGRRPFDFAHQYVNMGPRIAEHPELELWASTACENQELPVRVVPIRGGTGVDPFLDAGIPVANVGTGYFAPESEKEFTSVQMMGRHAKWLVELVGVVARG